MPDDQRTNGDGNAASLDGAWGLFSLDGGTLGLLGLPAGLLDGVFLPLPPRPAAPPAHAAAAPAAIPAPAAPSADPPASPRVDPAVILTLAEAPLTVATPRFQPIVAAAPAIAAVSTTAPPASLPAAGFVAAAAATLAAPSAAPVPSTTVPALVMEAVVPQPSAAGQVVGLVLQNPTTFALPARYVSLGMDFSDGQVPAGQSLVAEIGGVTEPVQMDVKTTYADGSARMAVLTLQQPTLAAGAAVGVMLAKGAADTAPALDISTLTNPANYNFTVSLTGISENQYSAANSTTPATSTPIADQTFNVGTLLANALAGTGGASVSYWQQGPLATQVRIDSGQIAGTPMHLTFDITVYADGSTSTDVTFANDIAMQSALGTQATSLSYNFAITLNGGTVLSQSGINQWQYQTWHQAVYSNNAPGVNIQHDIPALEKTGSIQNYDTTSGVDASTIATEAGQLGGSTYGILGSASVQQYMPTTGGRPDIGPQPRWNAIWLMTQDPTAAAYALAQANAAGSVPWNIYDPATNTTPDSYIMASSYPLLWDNSAGGTGGTQALAQPAPSATQTGWTPDAAHQPDLSYIAYLLTGDRTYLDELNAQASFDVISNSPATRLEGQGVVSISQVRQQAWSLREIVEAASANPTGSAMQLYFTQVATNSISYMLEEANTLGAGAVSGWFPGVNSPGAIPPWQEDYLASTLGLACGLGIPGAKALLGWEANFLAGMFLNGSNGFSPTDGADYELYLYNPTSANLQYPAPGTAYTSWSAVSAATTAATLTTPAKLNPADFGTGALLNSSNYQQLITMALAEAITWTGSPAAMQAYGWLLANAGYTAQSNYQTDPSLNIVPRLADGTLLTNGMTFVRNDNGTAPVTVQEGSGDQLVYEQGSAPVTIIGGSGINILFGGSGTTTLIGGPGSDYLFGGAGTTTFEGGSGNNFMEAGSGAAIFDLSPTDIGHDIIAGFNPLIDRLQITGVTPGSGALTTLLGAVTQDAAGNAVLHLSATHDVTIQGIAPAALVGSLFI